MAEKKSIFSKIKNMLSGANKSKKQASQENSALERKIAEIEAQETAKLKKDAEDALTEAKNIFSSGNEDQIAEYLNTTFASYLSEIRGYVFANTSNTTVNGKSVYSLYNYETSDRLFYVEPSETLALQKKQLMNATKDLIALDTQENKEYSYVLMGLYLETFTAENTEKFVEEISEITNIDGYEEIINIGLLAKWHYLETQGKDEIETAQDLSKVLDLIAQAEAKCPNPKRPNSGYLDAQDKYLLEDLIKDTNLRAPILKNNRVINGIIHDMGYAFNDNHAKQAELISELISAKEIEKCDAELSSEIETVLNIVESSAPEILENEKFMMPIAKKVAVSHKFFKTEKLRRAHTEYILSEAKDILLHGTTEEVDKFFILIADDRTAKVEIALHTADLERDGQNVHSLYSSSIPLELEDLEVTDENRQQFLKATKTYMQQGILMQTALKKPYLQALEFDSDEEMFGEVVEASRLTHDYFGNKEYSMEEKDIAEIISNYVKKRIKKAEANGEKLSLSDELVRIETKASDIIRNEFNRSDLRESNIITELENSFLETEYEEEIINHWANKLEIFNTTNIYEQSDRFSSFLRKIQYSTSQERVIQTIAKTLPKIKDIKVYVMQDVVGLAKPVLKSCAENGNKEAFENTMAVLADIKRRGVLVANCFFANGELSKNDELETFEAQQLEVLDKEVIDKIRKSKHINVFTTDEEILGLATKEEQDEIRKELQREKMELLVGYYQNYGAISPELKDEFLNIARKTNPNFTDEHLKSAIKKNPNLQEVFEYVQFANKSEYLPSSVAERGYPKEANSERKMLLYDIAELFPKTRFQALPDSNIVFGLTPSQRKNFDLKTYNRLSALPIFGNGEDGRTALLHIINTMGIFENDADVEKRRQKAFELFENAGKRIYEGDWEASMAELFRSRVEVNGLTYEQFKNDAVVKSKTKHFILRREVVIPSEFSDLFAGGVVKTQEFMSWIKGFDGVYGKKLNDFISPYAKTQDGYKLKRNVHVPANLLDKLRPELTVQEYNDIIKYDDEYSCFVNPFKESEADILEINKLMPKEVQQTAQQAIISYSDGTGMLGGLSIDVIHRMFDGNVQDYNPEFYEMLMRDLPFILNSSEENQRQVLKVCEHFNEIKRYYTARGNENIRFSDAVSYLEECPFSYDYGNYELAQEAKNAGVPDQALFDAYQELEKQLHQRKLSTIPRHEKTYTYTDKKGKEHQVMAKILRLDDPLNMFVGESKFSNCCQIFGNAGEECMKHASTSKDGGIFAVYVIEDGQPVMLTQSWIWQRETKLCLDNVEATEKGKTNPELYGDMVAFAIRQSSKDIVQSSKEAVENYIERETIKINNLSISEQEKADRIEALQEIRKRQTVQRITVGDRYSDLGVGKKFSEVESIFDSEGPKNYKGYRDSGVEGNQSLQRVVFASETDAVAPSEEYVDTPIYRDEREVFTYTGLEIPQRVLKKITEIEQIAHKKEMQMYQQYGKPKLDSAEILADIYDVDVDKIRVMVGEDWYFVYSKDENNIEIQDFARTTPRLEDEGNNQQSEMLLGFNEILAQSVEIEDGRMVKQRVIFADLREDTSYLLYLLQKKRGIIEQQGADRVYRYGEDASKEFTEEEQKALLKQYKQVMESGNTLLNMHSVKFVPSERFLRDLKGRQSKTDEKESVNE